MADQAKIRSGEINFDEGDTTTFHVLLTGKDVVTGELVQQTFDMLLATLDDEVALLESAATADPSLEWV